MHRVESSESSRPQRLRGLFYGPTELRAGWRLLIFIAMALGLLTVKDVIFAKTMHGVDRYTVFAIGDGDDRITRCVRLGRDVLLRSG